MPCTGAASKGGTFVNIGRPEKIIIRFTYQNYMDDIGKEGREGGTQHSFILGGSAPGSNNIILCNFQQKRCPFHMRSLELCMKGDQRTVFKI